MTNATFNNGYALLIGVGADLPVTVKDATALRDVLIDQNRAAYPAAQVTLLTETAATRQNILTAFDEIITQVNQNPDATVIIYYSGHGGRIKRTNEYFLVPYGYDPSQRANTAISGLEFTQKIEAITAQKLVVLLDCCHAGGVPALKEPGEVFVKSPLPPELLNVLGTGSGRVVVASSREDEYSYTGQPYSAFTDCLLEALQGKAVFNKDGYARILDILVYLFDQVPKRASGPQHPFVNKVLDLGDNFPLCYYAGGSKFLPGEAATIVNSQISPGLTAGQRRRLQQKLDTLQQEWDIRTEKVKRMREAFAIEVGTAVKFQLEQQLLDEEAKLAHLSDELDRLESTIE
ncbi:MULTISPECIES: caspase family protein [unclassified Tolypothrix]|uniref:caspase family protein n=1 Tax=unclassified Tolypothrix TaxID=2649714 RepID=UPI0005EAC1FA|nr:MULTISPECIES: caspase family protein [unclassified Tolypothrix]BAY93498.1 peptidase C14 caspase catalytic subunit p20 [Microchaete diplosiphon NIES-3275]EKE99435.1 ICE-like protease p20 domain protein [Tolypothrix sp. PCC 7601]MBE9080796.1 caspase family protein [Tolypothrix sp. LEGE 11397]UYD27337.1 caspase family protein [Tolypothrix sp. PCC 7712]UYD36801.1 caspase family protein [Tolypothrix sp. PCC 7601]